MYGEDRIQLVIPTLAMKNAAEDMKQEFFQNGETVINGSALFDQMEYAQWLQHVQRNRSPETVQEDWVVADTFFAVREADGKLVGMIDIRHSLDNAFLTQYGGHIGYAVRPCERRKGYATQMLRLALAYAAEVGLSRVMLGCYSDNVASKRTIEACGGRHMQEKPYLDGKMMDIYWIHITS